MLSANLKTQSVSFSDSTKSSKTSVDKAKANKPSFDDYMSSSTNYSDNEKTSDISTKNQDTYFETRQKAISSMSEKDMDSVNQNLKSISQGTDDVEGIVAEGIVAEENIAEESIDLEAMLANMAGLMTSLQESISQILGVSTDTLNQAMEELGFNSTDLLSNDNLKELVLFLNNSKDMADLLTDENLGNTLKELLDTVNEFKTNHQLTDEKIASYEKLLTDFSELNSDDLSKTTEKSVDTEPKIVVVKEDSSVETDDSAGDLKDDTSGNKGNNTQSLTPTEAFIQNLTAASVQETGFTEQIASIRQMREITDQIVEQIKITMDPSQTTMELQLNPENLGKVNLSVVYKDGVMTAQFTAQNETVKEALESQMQQLKESFANQGLKVESVEVTVSNFAFKDQTSSQNGQESEQSGNKNKRFRTLEDIGLSEELEPITQELENDIVNGVDIMA